MKMKCRDANRSLPRRARRSAIFRAALAAAFALAGCGGAGEQASKMTSFSTAESAASKAELFSLAGRSDVAHSDLHRRRRRRSSARCACHGSGGLQRLPDDAGDHASGRAGEPHRGHARRARDRGPAAAVRGQPRLLAAALRLHQGARRLPARGQILQARAGPLRAPSHRAGRSRAGRIQPHAGAGRPAIQRTGHSRSGNRESGKRS